MSRLFRINIIVQWFPLAQVVWFRDPLSFNAVAWAYLLVFGYFDTNTFSIECPINVNIFVQRCLRTNILFKNIIYMNTVIQGFSLAWIMKYKSALLFEYPLSTVPYIRITLVQDCPACSMNIVIRLYFFWWIISFSSAVWYEYYTLFRNIKFNLFMKYKYSLNMVCVFQNPYIRMHEKLSKGWRRTWSSPQDHEIHEFKNKNNLRNFQLPKG